ncbi:MAG: hypothetical protein M3P98_00205 [bacterium]|nr:hypothetical protein [bacterium]
MSNLLFAFLIGLPVGVWVYSKMYRRTGGESKSAITVGAGIGILAFLFAWFFAATVLN